MSKTKTDYLTNFTRYPELAEKVLDQIDNWSAIKENPEDYLNASNKLLSKESKR